VITIFSLVLLNKTSRERERKKKRENKNACKYERDDDCSKEEMKISKGV